jgi:hypothetical protein
VQDALNRHDTYHIGGVLALPPTVLLTFVLLLLLLYLFLRADTRKGSKSAMVQQLIQNPDEFCGEKNIVENASCGLN